MRTPPHVVVFRVITVAITTLILAGAGFGLAGQGPLAGLQGQLSRAGNQLQANDSSGYPG